jgi:hypothetical protein
MSQKIWCGCLAVIGLSRNSVITTLNKEKISLPEFDLVKVKDKFKQSARILRAFPSSSMISLLLSVALAEPLREGNKPLADSARFSPSLIPSAVPPTDESKASEKQLTLIVILSVFGVVVIVLTIVCCAQRTQIQKGEGPVRPVSTAVIKPEHVSLTSSDGGAFLPGKLKYAKFDI